MERAAENRRRAPLCVDADAAKPNQERVERAGRATARRAASTLPPRRSDKTMANNPNTDIWSWYHEIPVVSRMYLTASVATTAACALDLVSPFSLYYNYSLIYHEGQIWRLATNFLFFGMFSLDFLFHMYFLCRYCRLLEEGEFRGRTGDFIVMLALARRAWSCWRRGSRCISSGVRSRS